MSADNATDAEQDPLPARASEQALIEYALAQPPMAGPVLTTSLGRAQLADALSRQGKGPVDCWFLDAYQAALADSSVDSHVRICVQADPPEGRYGSAYLPLSRGGEAELAREALQSCWQRLHLGGTLAVAVDNPQDRWLGGQLKRFGKVRVRREHPQSVLYVVRKDAELAKAKEFAAEFAFRDRGRLLHVLTRPGVFSHRRLDAGARHLMNSMEVRPGDAVLDIGCGAGPVSLAAAAIDPSVSVVAMDANTRAVACTQASATRNQLDNVAAQLRHDGPEQDGCFDVVVANPPYFRNYTIAARFARFAARGLRPGGRVTFVGKRPDWFAEELPRYFAEISVAAVKGYFIAQGWGRGRPRGD